MIDKTKIIKETEKYLELKDRIKLQLFKYYMKTKDEDALILLRHI